MHSVSKQLIKFQLNVKWKLQFKIFTALSSLNQSILYHDDNE